MKVSFNQSTLESAVAAAISCVSNKNTMAAAGGLLIDCSGENAGEGRAVIVGYDLEKGIRVEFDADIIEEGGCVIDAQSFNSMIRLMPGGNILLEVDESLRAKLSCGNSEYELNALAARDFPTLPDISNQKGFNIKQKDLKSIITQTLFAVAQNDARPAFNGALFKIKGNRITAVGCDSFRLAIRDKVCELENTSDAELDTSFIIPGRTLAEVVRLLDEPDEIVKINLGRKLVIFRFERRDIIFFSRLIESEYIDYERIIPKNSTIFVDIDSASFLGALERASLVTDEAAGKHKSAARCNFTDNRLEIMSVSQSGRVRDEIAVSKTGPDIEIGFNCRYLTDALKACTAEKLRLALSSPFISMIIEPLEQDNDDRFTYLALPIKIPK